jgi:hypothetical protein
MRRLLGRLGAVAGVMAVALLCSGVASAQAYDAKANPFPPNNEFGVWGAYSFSNDQAIGKTLDRQVGVLALRYSRTIHDWRSVALLYTLDVTPVTVVRQPTYANCGGAGQYGAYCQTGRETVYGGGINPIGLKLNFRPTHQLQPFLASLGGFVASRRPVPVDIPGGTQYNYTFDFQAGVQLFNANRTRAWTFGAKYAHISNAYRHNFNPGVDFNELFVGYSFFR